MAEEIYQSNINTADGLLRYDRLIPVSRGAELSGEERVRRMTPFLLGWYERERRVLPWRENPAPYYVWISEIMLQQTRVEAVKPYFARFIQRLPDIRALAEVEDEVLLKLWEGLGYYNRARNLKKAAQLVLEQYGGELPPDYEELLKLPGIGSYTAGAVASIAYGIPVPAVDGNVLRVLSRLTADDSDILKQSVKRAAERLLLESMPKQSAATFNQAMMEIGAMICLPNGEPRCGECPLAPFCLAHENGTELSYPVKKAKKERRLEERTILLLKNARGEIAVSKRPASGLLAGLYEFPNLSGRCSEQEILDYLSCQELLAENIRPVGAARHIFSHVEWQMQGYEIEVTERKPERPGGLLFAGHAQLREEYPLPNAFAAYKRYLGILADEREHGSDKDEGRADGAAAAGDAGGGRNP